MDGATYPSVALQRNHFEFSKESIQERLFNCGNLDSCNKREQKVRAFAKCSKCKWLRYCSQACQQDHWKAKHKLECGKPLTADDADALFQQRRIIIGAEGDVTPNNENATKTENSTAPSN